ncbi:MAG: tyrosine-type recombinase/integrase, partial [Candidatus Dormibacteraeota bacterium]|nr:tyrosine-type recombinase/integrase [Candidatus Dormibacteraeota bacterium]MBJ7603975.1 tyrosine-type recombinase/integrase [Candidatus Dormibacteraeota bacterium]
MASLLEEYRAPLARAPLSPESRRTYLSKVRQFLAWLGAAALDGDPLADAAARDWAVRDYRSHLQVVAKAAPATVNGAVAAVDDFYARRGLGPARAERVELPRQAPRALDKRASLRLLRAVEAHLAPRNRALVGVLFYAGARISEAVRLDVDDVRLSARKGTLRLLGKGGKVREVPVHAQLRTDLALWLEERPNWPNPDGTSALFLNQRGERLSVRGASDLVAAIAEAAGLDDETTAHILRHTFATTLVRGGADLVLVAELLGHARLETTR